MIVTTDNSFIPYPHVVMIWKVSNGEYFFHTTLGKLCSCDENQFNMFKIWCDDKTR